MGPEAFAGSLAAGAALGLDACFDLVARALATPRGAA